MTATETESAKADNEKCARCGAPEGGDLRTLFMSCMYAMDELPIPFNKAMRFRADLESLQLTKPAQGITLGDGRVINLIPAEVTTDKPLTPHELYTLTVCKDCRASWMGAIRQWYGEREISESPGTGIFVRRNGTNVEVSEEEWQRLSPGREPVRVKP